MNKESSEQGIGNVWTLNIVSQLRPTAGPDKN
jgi:hypothetical protein